MSEVDVYVLAPPLRELVTKPRLFGSAPGSNVEVVRALIAAARCGRNNRSES
eukprot:gene41176-54768_t